MVSPLIRWIWPLLLISAAVAVAQPAPPDDLATKQIAMLAAEAQFFAALAQSQKVEIDKLKADPCQSKDK